MIVQDLSPLSMTKYLTILWSLPFLKFEMTLLKYLQKKGGGDILRENKAYGDK
jgi:hypothetical protein